MTRPYQRAAIHLEKFITEVSKGEFIVHAHRIEKLLERYIVPEDAWRNAFAAMAEELGVKTGMSHCSESTFSVLKAIRELKERAK